MVTSSEHNSAGKRTGQVIRGTYRLGNLIGKGGMGEIYAAEHTTIPRTFAIKILRGDYADDEEALKRFHREARIAASVGSIHIVEVFDFNQAEDGCLFMAMELLEGESLTEHFLRHAPLDPGRWLALLSQIAEGLDAAHRAGVVHRDLKPDNLFLAAGPRGEEVLKILDFGISKIKTTSTVQTQAGAILGTPHYMSPEQAEGGALEVDKRADIFSLGAITYEALSGDMAFAGPSLPAVFMKICFEEPPSLAEIAPHLPPEIAAAVSRALAKEPTARFDSVQAFVDAFGAALEQAPGASAPVPAPPSPGPQRRAASARPSPQTTHTTLSGAASQATPPGPAPASPKVGRLPVIIGVGALTLLSGILALVFLGRGSTSEIAVEGPGPRPATTFVLDAGPDSRTPPRRPALTIPDAPPPAPAVGHMARPAPEPRRATAPRRRPRVSAMRPRTRPRDRPMITPRPRTTRRSDWAL